MICQKCGGSDIAIRHGSTRAEERIVCNDCTPPIRSKSGEWPRILKVNEAIVKRASGRHVHTWRFLVCDNTLKGAVAVIVDKKGGKYSVEIISKGDYASFRNAKSAFRARWKRTMQCADRLGVA